MKAKRRKVIILVLAIAILLALGTVCATQCAFFNGTKIVKPSPVDTSILKPLADYPNYDLDELKARIETLRGKEGVRDFSSNAWSGDVGRVWRFGFAHGSADISIWVYDRKEAATSALFPGGVAYNGVKPERIVVSNDVVATLNPIIKSRDGDAPWSYQLSKSLLTSVQIGNIVVDIDEYSDNPNTIGTDTNEALAQIVKVLLPDAK